MELIKKNIHMDRVKCSAETQITVEEDMNISDQKQDAFRIITEKGSVIVEEIRKSSDYVTVKGALCYSILYLTDEVQKRPAGMEGKIPFEEKVHMEGVSGNDTVMVKTKLEDITAGMINSRKMSIRALIGICLCVDELYDEEALVDIADSGPMEILKKPMDVTVLAVDTKDIYRIKEEIELSAGMPNIFVLIWKDLKVNGLEFKALDGKISVQGEISGFFLYEGEGEERPIRYFEFNRPFGGVMELSGCREDMILDMDYEMEHEDIEVRPDFDGEERIFGIDLALNLYVKLMETQNIQMIRDVYGIMQDVEVVQKEGNCRNLLMKNIGKKKISGVLKVEDKNLHILQVCHMDGELCVEEESITPDGIKVAGAFMVKVIYITGNDEVPYACLKGSVPFEHTMEIQNITQDSIFKITAQIEQMTASMSDAEEMDVKAVLSFCVIAYEKEKEPMLTDVAIKETDFEKRNTLPGMVVYIAKQNDHIWNVGKKYCVPIQSIREINHLTKDELNVGEKILVVKEMV